MEMTIDEAIKDIELTCEYLKIMGVFDHPANEKCKPSLDMAIETMRKYQKIKEQVDIAIDKENFAISGARLIQIREIINGNDD